MRYHTPFKQVDVVVGNGEKIGYFLDTFKIWDNKFFRKKLGVLFLYLAVSGVRLVAWNSYPNIGAIFAVLQLVHIAVLLKDCNLVLNKDRVYAKLLGDFVDGAGLVVRRISDVLCYNFCEKIGSIALCSGVTVVSHT